MIERSQLDVAATRALERDVTRPPVPQALEETRVVAILRRTEPRLAVETAEALVSGGVRALEVTFNSPGVLDMLRAIQRALGDRVLLCAGTVLDQEQAEAALDVGVRLIVSPHTDPALIKTLARREIPVVPGALTPTEVLAAWRAGASVVKLFPAGPVGAGYIKDLRGPLAEIPLLPTGGVSLDTAASFIDSGAWGLGLGSALVDPGLVAAGAFDELAQRARAFVAIAAQARTRA
ncbi:MAG: bifunctional 4-hydroxy-2-oxoglutarate aldolase/2-dehydro-3-deoxy-phosphogluconate aldolase [Chloroflexota bacterium]|nr:bifunctional 4-hydroxy-2-oxoglutarate aldolase/2-dehydro-3-deoxy-phosphogluconate aldolase [Chloroflexota bacterium]